MTKSPEPASSLRRQPTQDRAQKTIETIFQATAQIVESEGEDALSTNKIAAKAGFSIGTLYQYFPSKEAILLAMIARERRRVLDRLGEVLKDAEQKQATPRQIVNNLIHLLVESFAAGHGVRRAMIRLAWQVDHLEGVTQAMREASETIALYLARLAPREQDLKFRTSPATLFVVTRAVMGTIRSASLERSALLGSREFEEELVKLALGLLIDFEHGGNTTKNR
jgi:AcrR family transcriptional regulator